ncbi:carbohydrate porin [Buttiauxella sp. S04-F03]|uniref:carbohydrate porin n=1 Tax=Buttiauxella sp. W03-F01 TaxID=2904524 RepID=UPI001E5D70EC|nr:carbohydrate porin [Buttiauxella sp. W03-F01]MCE0800104.1 carbohydrate porin [Buttiauxella sp. W03-F01]
MKIIIGSVLCAGLYSTSGFAQSPLTIEQRFALLEQRLQDAEKRADKAESEIATLKQVPTTENENKIISVEQKPTPKLALNNNAELKFYGDVEFNIDGASRTGSLTSVKTSANKNWAPGDKERWDINGRILLGVDGIQHSSNGQYAGFTVQPLADMNGKMNLDDAAFFFGQKQDWLVKVGRFEAYDMFPLNQDTFIEYSGNTANDLYSDGYGYIYMMKEARGRSNSGGNLLFSKTLDNWYMEVNTLVEDGSSLYVDQRYHGTELDNQKNVVYVRPVIAWRSGDYSMAAAMETNLINNAYGYKDAAGTWHDQSGRTGYGLTMSWNTLKNNPQEGVVVNLNTAYMNAEDEKDFSTGINALWHRVELGYIYAHNKISDFNISGLNSECGNECAILAPGNYDIHTIHTSWQLPNIMDMPNFNIYLGAYASWLNSTAQEEGDDQPRYGARLRFKYLF